MFRTFSVSLAGQEGQAEVRCAVLGLLLACLLACLLERSVVDSLKSLGKRGMCSNSSLPHCPTRPPIGARSRDVQMEGLCE